MIVLELFAILKTAKSASIRCITADTVFTNIKQHHQNVQQPEFEIQLSQYERAIGDESFDLT